MTRRPVADTAASVRQRLLNIARDKDRPFNEVLQYFAMERFLYRLGKSDHDRKFILKGALMLVAWKAPLARSTKDIDLLGRMKDFFDIWLLSRQFEFNGRTLSDAIRETFSHRETEVSVSPVAFTKAFSDDPAKILQWRAFVRKSRIPAIPESLGDIVAHIALFLGPVAEALSRKDPFFGNWRPPGPWIAGKNR